VHTRRAAGEMTRNTTEVFDDHLRLRMAGDLETDLSRKYFENVALLTVNSNAQGHDALRTSAKRLSEQLPNAKLRVPGEAGQRTLSALIWRATSDRFSSVDGADAFVIEDGRIQMQKIQYHLIGEDGISRGGD
jgi:hypothetical protein